MSTKYQKTVKNVHPSPDPGEQIKSENWPAAVVQVTLHDISNTLYII